MITNLLTVATKIRDMDVLVGAAFLDDINDTSSSTYHLSNNITNIDTGIIDAWTTIKTAKSVGYRKDWSSLFELKNYNSTDITNLQGYQSLVTILGANKRQPCKTCQVNNMTKDYLQSLDLYLKDLKNISQYNSKEGYSKVITLLKSKTLGRILEPEAFIIKVINSENLSPKEFEKSKTGCEPDVILTDGTFCEFKSWRVNPSVLQEENDVEEEDYTDTNTVNYDKSKTQFDNFIAGQTGVKQFTAYLKLSDVSPLNKLRYYFDAKKGATESYVKNVFKQMMYKNSALTPSGTIVFDAIWSNLALRSDLFMARNETASKIYFIEIIADINNDFYKFIKVK